MVIGIVTSGLDPAGQNVRSWLLANGFKERMGEFEGEGVYRYGEFILVQTKGSLLTAEHLDDHFDVDSWIFGSKHVSKAGVDSFTVHSTGNWSKAEFGGEEESLSYVDPKVLKNCFLGLQTHAEGHIVTLEATHHGPTELKKPLIFIEIGANQAAWINQKFGEILGKAILKALEPLNSTNLAAFGGTHYPEGFNKLLTRTKYSIGHIYPKYQEFEVELIKKAIMRTKDCKGVVIDWKSLGKGQRDLVIGIAQEFNLPVHKLEDIYRGDGD